jgi:hypothetical protein
MLNDIQAQDIGETSGKLLEPVQSPMGSLADPVGITVKHEPRSNCGSMTWQRACWTTRSRNGAALILRVFGSWM